MADLNLSATQLDRYARQLVLDDVGPAGQQALLSGSALVVGAGGLGSPILQYLAAAGVGRLGIVDDDTVERSNLQRQTIHSEADIGRPKVESAADFINGLNPDVTVESHQQRVDRENVSRLIESYDVIIDASDNFRTRYLLNDACVLATTPLVHGAVYQFEGQITAFVGGQPCYRCLFPEAPPDGAVPNCATAGVLGVVPGTIGTMQATEAIKQLLSTGDSLAGRLVYYDALDFSVETVTLQPDPDCPICANPTADGVQALSYGDRYAIQ